MRITTGYIVGASYTLRVAKSAEKAMLRLRKRDRETHREIMRKVERILTDPHRFGHPLRSDYKGLWETHVKNNLLVYTIHEDAGIVEIIQYIDHDTL